MTEYKQCGRLTVKMYDLRSGGNVVISVPAGWNYSVPVIDNTITREEARDLHYMLARLIDGESK